MKCPHCLVEFHPNQKDILIGNDIEGGWVLSKFDCPACSKMLLFLNHYEENVIFFNGKFVSNITRTPLGKMERISSLLVRPKGISRTPCPKEVPDKINEDYSEACLVLADSPKASAALSRRCLQNVLLEKAGVDEGNLFDQIKKVIDRGNLPSHIADSIDAVRNIGNFSAHPIKSESTGEIVPVEENEAEWNLDVLEALFDFYYVQPVKVQAKKDALNEKLKDAGKKSMK